MANNSGLELLIGTKLNTQGAQQALDKFVKTASKTKVIDLGANGTQFNTLTTYVNNLGQSYQRLISAVKDGNGQWSVLQNQVTSVNKTFSNFGNSLVTTSKYTDKFVTDTGALRTVITEVNAKGERIRTTIDAVDNGLGRLTTTTRVYNETLQQQISEHVESINDQQKYLQGLEKESASKEKLSQSAEKSATAQEKDTQAKKENIKATEESANANKRLGQSFTDVIGKVAKFYVATLPIQAFRKAITDSIQVVRDFDSAMTEFAKVSTLSGSSLQEYADKLGELGKTVARTKTEMVESATEFKKAGFDEEDSAKLAQIASLYQNTADEELSASEATSVLVSQLKAFTELEDDVIHITDAINKVSQDFAVSSADIGKGLTQAGASLKTYGNSFDQTIGLLTAGTEIFQGKSQQVARGLNQIANRISKNEEALAKYGVAVKDQNGNLRSTFDVLRDLKSEWDKMSNTEQVALGTTLAGTNQYKILSAVMSNFDSAVKATNASISSYGTTMKQNEVYMDSLEAKLQALKTEFETLVLGNGGLQNFVKTIVELGTKILQFANSDVGQLIIKIIALNVATLTLINSFNVLKATAIGKWFVLLSTQISATGSVVKGLVLALKTLELNPIVLGIVALVTAIYGAKKAYDHFYPSVEKLQSKLKDSQSEYQNTVTELEGLESELKRVDEEIRNLKSQEKLSLTEEKDLTNLRLTSEELKKQIVLLKEHQSLKQKEVQANLDEYLNKNQTNPFRTKVVETGTVSPTYDEKKGLIDAKDVITVNEETNPIQILKDANAELIKYGQIIDELASKKENNPWTFSIEDQIVLDEAIEKYKLADEISIKYANDLSSAQEGADEASESYKKINEVLKEHTDIVGERSEALSNATDTLYLDNEELEDFTDTTEEATKSLKDMAKELGVTEDKILEYADALNTTIDGAYDYISLVKKVDSQMSDLSSAYSTLTKAVDEYASTGQISFETLNNLLKLNPEYIDCLTVENGMLKINEEALRKSEEAMMANVDALLAQQAEAEIAQIVNKYYSQSLDGLGTSAVDVGAKVEEAGLKAKQSGENAREGGDGWVDFWNSITRDTVVRNNDMQKEIDGVRDKYKKLREDAYNTHKTITSSTKSSSSANKGLSSSIDLVTKAIEKQINALKKEKEVALDAIESQIKALQKEKEARVKAIEKEIKALEKQKKEREKYWEDQLKKLEKENDERERGIELEEKKQKLALAQQQNVMLFKDGQFQYSQDEDAIASAQQDLQETEDKQTYERQKELIEELRDTELEWYEERIEALEEYKEMVEEYYDEQIEQLEEYKEYLSEYYDEQIEKLEETKERVNETFSAMSADLQAHYATMLADASTFVEAFNAIMAEMGKFGVGNNGETKMGFSTVGESTGDNDFKLSHYASGKGSIKDSELAVVGENPKYREIIIGSKLNHDQGVVMNLKRGSGVVNAGATNTLASLFNSLNGAKSNAVERTVNNNGTTISIGNISLPEVKDGNGFVEYLQNFSLDLTQKAYSF